MVTKGKESIETAIVTLDQVERRIYSIRGHKVMLDSDLSALYGVRTSNLNKAVSRNIDRFPEDFMFQVENEEFANLRFQFGTSSLKNYGGRRYVPYVFTEQGARVIAEIVEVR